MLKKITSYLIAISLIVTTIFLGVPTNVNAEELKSNDDARKQIMLGTDGLKMWREQNDVNPDITINPLDKGSAEIIKTRIEKLNKGYDYIWYGKTPTRWRLLDKESTNEKDKNGLLLLSNNAIKDNEIFFNPFEKRNDINVYQGSELQKYIKNYGENNFTDLETKSMMETYKSDPYELSEQGTNYEGGTILKNKNYNINNLEYLVSDKWKLENILAGDKLFPLSVKEASNNEYGFVMDDSRWVFYDDDLDIYKAPINWWLRTPYDSRGVMHSAACANDTRKKIGIVHTYRYIYNYNGKYFYPDQYKSAVRPAFNLKKDSVLLVTPVLQNENGKDFGKDGLSEVKEVDFVSDDWRINNQWKLTLKDDSRKFNIKDNKVFVKNGKIDINYEGAKTGENEYISVIITDENGAPVFYSHENKALDENGTVSLNLNKEIEEKLKDGKYKVKVFNEQINGNKETDYSSELKDVEVMNTVEDVFTLRYRFVSEDGKELPGNILKDKPKDEINHHENDNINKDYADKKIKKTDITVEGGAWHFEGWAYKENGKYHDLSKEPIKMHHDLELIGVWSFKANSTGGGGGGTIVTPPTYPDRIEGNDRIETSVETSKDLYPNGTNAVVLANAERYTDVLTADPFAIQEKASALLTYKYELPEKTLKEIQRLGAKKIYISGGYEAVSKKVVDELAAKGYEIFRFDGVDRYDTARKIAIKIREKGNTNTAELASGEDFPDALCMTPLAVKDHAPILLTKKDSIPKYTKQALAEWDIENIKIGGLEKAVSKEVEKQLKSGFEIEKNNKKDSNVYDGAKAVKRIGGEDRYETSAKLAAESYPDSKLGVYATGEDFPDALIAGNYAGRKEAPVLLVKRDTLPEPIEKYTKESKIKKATIIGGVNAVSDKVLNLIKDAIRK